MSGAVAAVAVDREVLDPVRRAVRRVLDDTPAFAQAPPQLRRQVAEGMVKVSSAAASLIAGNERRKKQLARAQSASDQWNPKAAQAAAGQIKALKEAIDFPTFVTSLINGVFESITKANLHQLEAFADLLDNVSASSDEFQDANITDAAAVQWAAGKFPFLKVGDGGTLALRKEDDDLTNHSKALKVGLGLKDSDASSIGDIETLMPFVQTKMAADRQSILATMVQMGMQRVVVDEGRLHASMDLRVDTSSISEELKSSKLDWGVSTSASGSFGIGAWGASASISAHVAQVQSDQQYTQEQLASRAQIRSSVDLAFRTDQIPLDKMASPAQRAKLDSKSRVPADVSDKAILSPTKGQIGAADMKPTGNDLKLAEDTLKQSGESEKLAAAAKDKKPADKSAADKTKSGNAKP